MTSLSIGLAFPVEVITSIEPPPTAPPVTLITVDGIPTLDNLEIGQDTVIFTVSGTSAYAGDHEIDTVEQAMTATGPVNEVLPDVTGTLAIGEVLLCDGGLWAFNPNLGIPSYSFQWQRDDVDIPLATGVGYELTSADMGQSIRCLVQASQPVGSRTAPTPAQVSSGPPVQGFVERVGNTFYSDLTLGSTGEFTVDLSAYDAGDTIIIFSGPAEFVAQGDLTVDDVAATKLTTSVSANFGARRSAFSYVLDAPGSANTIVRTVNGITQASRYFAVFAVRGYQISTTVSEISNANTLTLSTDFAITSTQNIVLSCAIGLTPAEATWSMADEQAEHDFGLGSVMTAIAQDLSPGAAQHQVTFGSAGRASLVSVILENA